MKKIIKLVRQHSYTVEMAAYAVLAVTANAVLLYILWVTSPKVFG